MVRTEDGLAAFVHYLFCPTGSTMEDRDPVVRAILGYVERDGAHATGRAVSIGRFMRGTGAAARPYALLAARLVDHAVVIESVAWSFLVYDDEECWAPNMDYLGLPAAGGGSIPVASATSSTATTGGASRWTAGSSSWDSASTTAGTGPPPESMLRPLTCPGRRSGRRSLGAASTLNRPDQMAATRSSAARSGTPGRRAGEPRRGDPPLGREPKGDQLSAVLHRTFVRAAPTQEAAAEALGQPFSTYRRHLARAIDQLTEVLWAAEIGTLDLGRRHRAPIERGLTWRVSHTAADAPRYG